MPGAPMNSPTSLLNEASAIASVETPGCIVEIY